MGGTEKVFDDIRQIQGRGRGKKTFSATITVLRLWTASAAANKRPAPDMELGVWGPLCKVCERRRRVSSLPRGTESLSLQPTGKIENLLVLKKNTVYDSTGLPQRRRCLALSAFAEGKEHWRLSSVLSLFHSLRSTMSSI